MMQVYNYNLYNRACSSYDDKKIISEFDLVKNHFAIEKFRIFLNEFIVNLLGQIIVNGLHIKFKSLNQ